MTTSASLLAQALEVPSSSLPVSSSRQHPENALILENNDDGKPPIVAIGDNNYNNNNNNNHDDIIDDDIDDIDDDNSLFPNLSETPRTAHHFPPEPEMFPQHSDYTIPTSNKKMHQEYAQNQLYSNDHNNNNNNNSNGNNYRKNNYITPTSPPAEITPQKRRSILGTNAKSRYNVQRSQQQQLLLQQQRKRQQQQQQQQNHVTNNNNNDHHMTTGSSIVPSTTVSSTNQTPYSLSSSSSVSPPHSPTARLLNIPQQTPSVVSPLTPFDRHGRDNAYANENTPTPTSILAIPSGLNGSSSHHKDPTNKQHQHHSSKKKHNNSSSHHRRSLLRPKRLHETVHAQSLLIGLAFMAIWIPNNVMAPNLTQMATKTFYMSNDQRDLYLGSYCALAVGVFSLPISALVGFMVDFYSRKRLFVCCVLGSSVASIWTAMSQTFSSLFFARLVTGGFMSASVPVAFSLLGDLFSTEERNAASSGLTAMMGCGMLVGQVYSGVVGPSLGWQHPFVVSSVLSLISALAVAIWVQEPDRGAKEKVLQELLQQGSKYERKLTWKGFVHAMQSNVSNKILLWSGFFTSLPWGIVFVFLNDYLSQEKGFTVPDATFMVMLFGIGCAIGGICGGYLGQNLQKYNRSYLPLYMALSTFLGILPFVGLLNSQFTNHHGYKAMAYSILGGCVASLPSVNVRPCILNVNPPETRGAALTAANLLVALGRGIGPSCITTMISVFHFSRQTAFNTTLIGFWTITAIQLLFLANSLPKDQDAMEAELARYAAEAKQLQFQKQQQQLLLHTTDRTEKDDEDGNNNNNDPFLKRYHDDSTTTDDDSYVYANNQQLGKKDSTEMVSLRQSLSSPDGTGAGAAVNGGMLNDDAGSLVSIEEYMTSFDGTAARRSIQFVRQGIQEIQEEMTCMACVGHYSSSSEEDEEMNRGHHKYRYDDDDDDDDMVVSDDDPTEEDIARRKEVWLRHNQRLSRISSVGTASGSSTDSNNANNKNGNRNGNDENIPNEKTPLMLV